MRFTELEPCWLTWDGEADEPTALDQCRDHRPLGGACGVQFLCPACVEGDGHSIRLMMAHTPENWEPLPGRWRVIGHRLSACTIAPSVKLVDGCCAHFIVKHGEIQWP